MTDQIKIVLQRNKFYITYTGNKTRKKEKILLHPSLPDYSISPSKLYFSDEMAEHLKNNNIKICNYSNAMIDYFENDQVIIKPDHPLYSDCLEAHKKWLGEDRFTNKVLPKLSKGTQTPRTNYRP